MAQNAETYEGLDVTNEAVIDGVVVRIEHGPKIWFVDLDGDSSIGEILQSDKLSECDLYYDEYIIEGIY